MLRRASSTLFRSWVSAGLILTGGCCNVPLAERYFYRETPYNALLAFAYAVDAGQWPFAYQCLTEGSRKAITFSKFKLALRFGVTLPGQEIPVRDLIVSAERHPSWETRVGPRHALVPVRYQLPDGTLVERNIFFEREREEVAELAGRDPVWQIDLEQTVSTLRPVPQAASAGPIKLAPGS